MSNALSASPWYSQRRIKLAIDDGRANSTIDFDKVRLADDSGRDLPHNGDFSHGLDNWFFVTVSHLQWHIKRLFYTVLFDQGWFGLAALDSLLFLVLSLAVKSTNGGDILAAAGLASIAIFWF